MALHPEIEKYLKENKAPVILLRYLNSIPEEIKFSVDRILKISTPNIAILKQLLELSSDINSKTNSNPLDDKYLMDLIKDSGIKDAVKYLRRKRMPKISQRIADINSLIKKAELKTIKIDFDQSFERQNISLNAELSSTEDIELLKQDLDKIKKTDILERIIKRYKL